MRFAKKGRRLKPTKGVYHRLCIFQWQKLRFLNSEIVDKHLVPNEDADAVRQVFEFYNRTGNLHETMRFASSFGVFPSTSSAFKKLLQNPSYIGVKRGNNHFCEEIVDRDLFFEIQRKLSLNLAEMISLDEYKSDRESISAQIAALSVSEPERDLSALREILETDIESLYRTLDPSEKRFFLRSIIQEIRFDQERNIEVVFLP